MSNLRTGGEVIADHLGVSDRTVEMHIQAVRVKLRVSSLLQAALVYDRSKGGARGCDVGRFQYTGCLTPPWKGRKTGQIILSYVR